MATEAQNGSKGTDRSAALPTVAKESLQAVPFVFFVSFVSSSS